MQCLTCQGEFKSLRDSPMVVGKHIPGHCPHCNRIGPLAVLAEAGAERPTVPDTDYKDVTWLYQAFDQPAFLGPGHYNKVNGYRTWREFLTS